VHSLDEQLPNLHRDHFKCVKDEVFQLINNTPSGDQVTVEISFLKKVHDYMFPPDQIVPY